MFTPPVSPSQGSSQYSPFTDPALPPGAQNPPAPAAPTQGGGTPNVPADPTLQGWRTGSSRALGAPMTSPASAGAPSAALTQAISGNGSVPGGVPNGGYTGLAGVSNPQGALQSALAGSGSVGITDPGQGPNVVAAGGVPSAQSATSTGYITDPTQWMAIASDPAKRLAYVKSKQPGISDQKAQYFADVIGKQPGANPTEQAGSDQYYTDKINGGNGYGGPATPEGGTGNFLSAPQALSTDQTGSSNPLLAAIRQSLLQQPQPGATQ